MTLKRRRVKPKVILDSVNACLTKIQGYLNKWPTKLHSFYTLEESTGASCISSNNSSCDVLRSYGHYHRLLAAIIVHIVVTKATETVAIASRHRSF